MADRRAVVAGLWSNPATWDGGVSIPGPGDVVRANGVLVSIDQDVTVAQLRTDAGGGAVAGGSFTPSINGITINAPIIAAGSGHCINNSNFAITLLNINGSVYGGVTGLVNCFGLFNSVPNSVINLVGDVWAAQAGTNASNGYSASQGVLNLTGNVYGGFSTASAGVVLSSNGTINMTGNVYTMPTGLGVGINGGNGTGTNVINGNVGNGIGRSIALSCAGSGGSTVVNGDVRCGDNTASYGAIVTGIHNMTINGDVYGGTNGGGTGYGLQSAGTGEVIVNGRAIGGPGLSAPGVYISTTNPNVFVREAVANNYPNEGIVRSNVGILLVNDTCQVKVAKLTFGSGGANPLGTLGRYFIVDAEENSVSMRQSNVGPITVMGEVTADYPSPANVRAGTAFNFGAQTGTLAVPPAGAVAVGVPVDATVGTANLTQQDIANAVGPLFAASDP